MVSSICQWVTSNHPHGRDSPAESPPIYRDLKARTHGVPVSPPSAGQGADHLYGTPSLASWRYAWSEVGVPGWGSQLTTPLTELAGSGLEPECAASDQDDDPQGNEHKWKEDAFPPLQNFSDGFA